MFLFYTSPLEDLAQKEIHFFGGLPVLVVIGSSARAPARVSSSCIANVPWRSLGVEALGWQLFFSFSFWREASWKTEIHFLNELFFFIPGLHTFWEDQFSGKLKD